MLLFAQQPPYTQRNKRNNIIIITLLTHKNSFKLTTTRNDENDMRLRENSPVLLNIMRYWTWTGMDHRSSNWTYYFHLHHHQQQECSIRFTSWNQTNTTKRASVLWIPTKVWTWFSGRYGLFFHLFHSHMIHHLLCLNTCNY